MLQRKTNVTELSLHLTLARNTYALHWNDYMCSFEPSQATAPPLTLLEAALLPSVWNNVCSTLNE